MKHKAMNEKATSKG